MRCSMEIIKKEKEKMEEKFKKMYEDKGKID
jgi:hypothetical protein